MKKKKKKVEKVKHKGVAGSLAMRVFATGFLFLVIPLILYSLFIYNKEYKNQTYAFYKGLAVVEQDINNYFIDVSKDDLSYIDLVHSLVEYVKHDSKLVDKQVAKILEMNLQKRKIGALFYCQNIDKRGLICTSATRDGYIGLNFNKTFSQVLAKDDHGMFVVKDPLFSNALYVYKAFNKKDSNELDGVIVEVIDLKNLVAQLAKFQNVFKLNISILDANLNVLASSEPMLEKRKFLRVKQEEKKNYGLEPTETGEFPLFESSVYNGGFHYYVGKKNRLALFSKVENLNNFLLISIPERLVLEKILKQLAFLGFFLFFIVLIGSLLSILVAARMARPLKKLSNIFEGVGRGDLEKKYTEDRFGFEINFLGRSFNQMLSSLKVHIKQVQEEKAQKEAYIRELEIGRQIQYAIFPQKNMEIEGIDSSFYFLGAQEVAGDFYDWNTKDNKTMIVVADGVGKGILGCLYSLDLRSILRTMAQESDDLIKIVTATNQIFCSDTKDSGNFVTAFVGVYDHATHKMQYVNCGHNPPFHLMQDGQVHELHTHGMAFGVDESVKFELKELDLKREELILFFTDGVNETMNEKGELFTTKRLIEELKSLKDLSAANILVALNQDLETFQGAASQHDDKTMILFKRLR